MKEWGTKWGTIENPWGTVNSLIDVLKNAVKSRHTAIFNDIADSLIHAFTDVFAWIFLFLWGMSHKKTADIKDHDCR